MAAIESWLPSGLTLPDGALAARPTHEGADWQLINTQGGGKALLARESLHTKWIATNLVVDGDLSPFTFAGESLFFLTSKPSQILAPVTDGPSPNDMSEALAFSKALKSTRDADPSTPLEDSIYSESLGRLLPTYSPSAQVEDDLVLGYWLSGGVNVSVKSKRRMGQIMSWLNRPALDEVVAASGVVALFKTRPEDESAETEHEESSSEGALRGHKEGEAICGLESGADFELPGRPELEEFFNEHVVEIVRNKGRYKALGVVFPSAMVLHGPPGCGKTFAVEQLVEFLGWPSYQIEASSVASPYIHETSKKIADIFERAMKTSPSVLVIDEMESFLADRESGSGSSHHRVEEVAEFLRRIPEATKNEVLVVGMTNRIEMIDSAIMRRGRFDHVIEVNPASEDEIKSLLKKLLLKLPKGSTIDSAVLARRLSGRPLSDVTFVVREGARLCARAGLDHVEQAYLMAALESAPSRSDDAGKRPIGFL